MYFKVVVFLGFWLIETGCVLANISCGYGNSCQSNQICCNQQCVYGTGCAGRMCSYSGYDQCSGLQCCDGICQYSCYDTAYVNNVPIIIGIVAGVCFLVIVSIVICCICRRRNSVPRGGYVVTQPQAQVHFNQTTAYPTGQPHYQQGYGQANPQYGYGAI